LRSAIAEATVETHASPTFEQSGSQPRTATRIESDLITRYRELKARDGISFKLSLFAIADTIKVQSVKGGQRSGLVMRTSDIRQQMGDGEGTYHLPPIDASEIVLEQGTSSQPHARGSPYAAAHEMVRRRWPVIARWARLPASWNGSASRTSTGKPTDSCCEAGPTVLSTISGGRSTSSARSSWRRAR
jgi:hypothetical protein